MQTSATYSTILWDIIRLADGSEEKLKAILSSTDKDTIKLFCKEFVRASGDLKNLEARASLREISSDAETDVFEYVVSQGRDFYDWVLTHPHDIPEQVDSNDVWILGTALLVYWDRFRERIPIS